MMIVAKVLIALVAILHIYILYLEMFAWESKGPKVFRNIDKDLFPKTAVMAKNQGLYNGFLAAGLIWSLLIQDPMWSFYVALFFLSCVLVAGVYGAMTASRSIFKKQGLPAAIAIVVLCLAYFDVF